MLRLTNVTAGYGARDVLRKVNLTVPPGGLVALIGANGAGKTTLLRAVSGLVPVRSGSVRMASAELAGRAAHEIARLGLLHIPEGRGLFPRMTVEDNLRLFVPVGKLLGDFPEVFAVFPFLRGRLRQYVGSLSGGEQQMVSLARAILCKPKVLMVDELTLGLAPRVTEQVAEVLIRLNAIGTTIIVVEENLRMVLRMARWTFVLQNGEVVFDASVEEARRQEERLVRAYLSAN